MWIERVLCEIYHTQVPVEFYKDVEKEISNCFEDIRWKYPKSYHFLLWSDAEHWDKPYLERLSLMIDERRKENVFYEIMI